MQMSSDVTVVITGASGFLGRHVVEEIRKSNHPIFAICRSRLNSPTNLKREEIASVDSSSTVNKLEAFFATIDGPVVVVHLAAHYSNRYGCADKFIENNSDEELKNYVYYLKNLF